VCVDLFYKTDIEESFKLQSRGFFTRESRVTHLQFRIADVPPHPVLPYTILGGRILTLHFDYVAGYTDPFLLLFERTQFTSDVMTHLAFGNPPPPVLEKV